MYGMVRTVFCFLWYAVFCIVCILYSVYGVVLYGKLLYDMVLYGMAFYGMVCFVLFGMCGMACVAGMASVVLMASFIF